MARKIIYKENGLLNSGDSVTGYRFLGYDGTTLSEKTGSLISDFGGGGTPFGNNRSLQFNDNGVFGGTDNFTLGPNNGSGFLFTSELNLKNGASNETVGILGRKSDGVTPAFAIGYIEPSNEAVFFYNNTALTISNSGPVPSPSKHDLLLKSAPSSGATGGDIVLNTGSGTTIDGAIDIQIADTSVFMLNNTTKTSKASSNGGSLLSLASDGSVEYIEKPLVYHYASESNHASPFTTHNLNTKTGYLYLVTFGQSAIYDNGGDSFSCEITVGGSLKVKSEGGDRPNLYNDYSECTYMITGDGTQKSLSFNTVYSGGVVFNYSFVKIISYKL